MPIRIHALGVVLILSACGFGDRPRGQYAYVPPQSKSDGLAVADARSLGIDTGRIGDLVRPFLGASRGHHTSVLVMKDGRLIIEEYFHWRRGKRHPVQSVSKSLTSLVVGYALAHRYIGSIDDPISRYLPKYRAFLKNGKERITIRHLLTMTSGLQWDESAPYGEAENERTIELGSRDAIAFILDRPLAANPGETWNYNGGGMTLLGEIMVRASGLTAQRLVRNAFAGLLTDDELELDFEADGSWNAAGGFTVTPRGMAKIGQMMLQRGRWNNIQMFDPHWIDESTAAVMPPSRVGYGYLWLRLGVKAGDRWIEAVAANGFGGQHIFAIPDAKVVIVTTATDYGTETPPDTITSAVMTALGPQHLAGGRLIAPQPVTDSLSAFPRIRLGWSEVAADTSAAAAFRAAVDTVSPTRLGDGSYLVWWRAQSAKYGYDDAPTYTLARYIVRCESPTDGRIKRVATTRFENGAVAFQDYVGVTKAMALPWLPLGMSKVDLVAFQRACERIKKGG